MPYIADVLEDASVLSVTPSKVSIPLKHAYELTPRQRKNAKRVSTPAKHSSFGGGSRKYSHRQDTASDVFDGVDPDIFFCLGVVVDPPNNSLARKDLVSKLIAAVKDDLQVIEQESIEANIREEGFWRWAGKSAWHNMIAVRQKLDWATGQKIDPSTRRPSYDMPPPPTFDDGLENDTPVSEFNEHAVKPPTEEPTMLPEDLDSVSSQDFACPRSPPLPKITEEPYVEEEFQLVTNKTRYNKTRYNKTASARRQTKNLAARASLVKTQTLAGHQNDDEDADFTSEVMASKYALHSKGNNTPEYKNAFYRRSKRQVFNPRQ